MHHAYINVLASTEIFRHKPYLKANVSHDNFPYMWNVLADRGYHGMQETL